MKILLTLIILLSSNQAFATDIDKYRKLYIERVKDIPPEKKLFIPKNTLVCGRKSSLITLMNQSMSEGNTLQVYDINFQGCKIMAGWSIGLPVETDKQKNITLVVYGIPMAYDKSDYRTVSWGWVFNGDLMTVKQRQDLVVS